MPRIYYTGTLIMPDGSDTNHVGEPCEPGQGYTESGGYIDPWWDRWEVRPNREDVGEDVWTVGDGPIVEWVIERLHERLDRVELDAPSDWYTGEWPAEDLFSVKSMSVCAHIEGLSDALLAAVFYGIAHRQSGRGLMHV